MAGVWVRGEHRSGAGQLGRGLLTGRFVAYGLILRTFLAIPLLRYNLHTLQFMNLKCTIQLFLVYSQSCAAVTTVNCNLFVTPQRNLVPLSHRPLVSASSPAPGNRYFRSLNLLPLDISSKRNHMLMWSFRSGFYH